MKLFFLLLLCYTALQGTAQNRWYNPMETDTPPIWGRCPNMAGSRTYHRLPDSMQPQVRPALWNLSTNSAGLSVRFYTNAPSITVKYTVKGNRSMPHMPATGVSGVDLYTTDCNGQQQWCAGRYAFGDTITYTYTQLGYTNNHPHGNAYTLYLPLYTELTHLQIGVPGTAEFRFITPPDEKPIVVYGTSITHGACASRPGMSWTNQVERALDWPLVNLGFSGNGLLEEPLFEQMAQTPARVYVIDCLPNLVDGREAWIKPRLLAGIKRLRNASDTPILLVEHNGYEGVAPTPAGRARYERPNRILRTLYDSLRQCIPALYYLSREEIAFSPDNQVDGVHPTDLGMTEYAGAYTRTLRKLIYPVTANTAFAACRQRREAGGYEWDERHREINRYVRQTQPEVVLIGNSITHYWGGAPDSRRSAGQTAWDDLFGGMRVANLGCGWDYIENVLWRIQHGELEGYKARHVFVHIGTNNLHKDTDNRIVDGICQLVQAIRHYQPEAQIHVCAIYPRRGQEKRLARLNRLLKKRLRHEPHTDYMDVRDLLTGKNGQVDETLFRDGLHPNAKGYQKLVPRYRQVLNGNK